MTAQLDSHLVLRADETHSFIVFIFSGRPHKQAMAVRLMGSANHRYVCNFTFHHVVTLHTFLVTFKCYVVVSV